MNNEENYFEETREFDVGDEWPFDVPIAKYQLDAPGAIVTDPTAVVIKVADASDVTDDFWPSGAGSMSATHARWSAFTFVEAGDYELRLAVLINGKKRTDRQRVKVYA